jgi:uncharacterized OB-fold protein
MDHKDLITIPGTWNFEYRYFAGETASRFFNALRDEARIYGTSCSKCGRVLVPARSFCDACFVATTGWVETGPSGVLEIFTIVATQFPGLPTPPFVIGYVTLNGASTAVLNYVRGIDLSDINAAGAILMKRPQVHARFADIREGRITDFHFEMRPS